MGYLLMKGEYFTFHGIFYTLNKKFAQKSPAFAGLSHLLIQERKEEFLVFIRVHIFFCDKLRSGIHHFRKDLPPKEKHGKIADLFGIPPEDPLIGHNDEPCGIGLIVVDLVCQYLQPEFLTGKSTCF